VVPATQWLLMNAGLQGNEVRKVQESKRPNQVAEEILSDLERVGSLRQLFIFDTGAFRHCRTGNAVSRGLIWV
jgi:hypothetical protein